ncbi:MAG: hypothetical protein WCH32_03510 [Pseudomonadota bacterium]
MRIGIQRSYFLTIAAILVGAATAPALALADEWPMVGGDFWEVTDVHVKDGGDLAYANFIASEWRADQEFAKSKGWIKNYLVLGNAYPRHGEADLYLVVISERLATGAEADKRGDEYLAWRKKTNAQLSKENGNRLEVREILGSALLQEFKFRK